MWFPRNIKKALIGGTLFAGIFVASKAKLLFNKQKRLLKRKINKEPHFELFDSYEGEIVD